MTETHYLFLLSRIKGISHNTALQLLEQMGSATAVFENTDALPEKARKEILSQRAEALRRTEQELAFCEEKGIRMLSIHDADYPTRLRTCAEAPFTIFYKGTASLNAKRIIAVVGTRKITEYGRAFCQDLCKDLASLIPDCLIVSGLAYGVDIHAHRACLKNSLPTVAVLAHGLDRIYPTMHRATAVEMLNHGGLLTEYAAGTAPDKGNFVRRNRIVAGMTDCTLVVESAEHGGALITAELAGTYGRRVFALPGRTTDAYSAGCNRLIRTGHATLVTSAEELVETMGWREKGTQPAPQQASLFPELTPMEAKLYDQLPTGESLPVNDLLRRTGLTYAETTAVLFELQMKNLVELLPGNRVRRI